MARPKREFSLYKRNSRKDLKYVYYARINNDDGTSITISTGHSSKAYAEQKAREYIEERKNLAKQYEAEIVNKTFADYAKGFWAKDGEFAQSRQARRRTISNRYLDVCEGLTKNYLTPKWGKFRLSDLTTGKIDEWILAKVKENKLASGTINKMLQTFKVMLEEACARGYITENPAKYVRKVRDEYKQKGVLTSEEVAQLSDVSKWSDYRHYALNMLTLSTGLRMSEVRGLLLEQIHPDFIEVRTAWEDGYGMKEPKCGSMRDVPITPKLYEILTKLVILSRPQSIVFYGKDYETPIAKSHIQRKLYEAMENIGIDPVQRKKRNLTFHSHRHTLNTLLRSAGVPDYKIRLITGHREASMTERYTHYRLNDLREVAIVQTTMF